MLIGLHGKARSGKTTVANHLKHYHDFGELSFAGPLKALVMDLFDMDSDQVNSNLKEQIDIRYGMSPRKLLQYIGTNVFRELYPTVWVDHTMRTYKRLVANAAEIGLDFDTIISDVRFRNEKEAIEKEGGVVWKIVREDHPGASSGIEGHASECDLDSLSDHEYAAVLSARSGDLEGLLRQADKAFTLVAGRKIENDGRDVGE